MQHLLVGAGASHVEPECVKVLHLLGLKNMCSLHSSSEQEQMKNCEPVPLISFIWHLLLL